MKFTKLGKKIIAFFAVIALGLVLAGCFEETPTVTLAQAQANVETVAGRVIIDKSVTSNVTSNLNLASSYAALPDVVYTWTSSEEDLVTIVKNEDGTVTAVVTRPEITDERIEEGNDYVDVTLTLTLTQKATDGQVATAIKVFELKVKVVSMDVYGSIKEVKDAAINQYVANNYAVSSSTKDFSLYCATYGRVLSFVGNKSMFIADGEDVILVYGDFTSNKVGDLVKVEGLVYGYYGQIEFGAEVNVTPVAEDETIVDQYGEEWRTHESFEMPEFENTTIEAYTNALKASVNAGNRIVDAEAFVPFSGGTYNLYGLLVKEDLATGDDYALVDPYNGEKVAIYHYSTDDNTKELDALVGKYVYMNAITVDRYSTNWMYRVLWTGATVVEANAPELTSAQKVAYVAKQLEYAFDGFDAAYYNGQEFAYPTVELEGVKVNWTVDPTDVLVDGKLVVTEDGTFTLTAEVVCDEEKTTVSTEVSVYAKESISTIEEVVAGDDDATYIIVGTVETVFSSYRNFYVKDETGTLLVYSALPDGIKAGDTVKVSGVKDTYNGCPQFATGATVTLVEEGNWAASEGKKVTVNEVLAYTQANAPYGEYLAISGVLVKGEDGYFYMADAADTTKQVSLYYSTVNAVESFANTGKEITIKAYFYGFSSAGAQRVVFSGRDGEYVLPELSDEEKVAVLKATLAEGATINASGEYPLATEEDGCKIAWELVDGAGVATLNVNVLTVTQGDAEAVVALKATITCGDVSDTVEFLIKVLKYQLTEHAGTAEDPYTATDAALATSGLEDKVATTEEYYVTGTVASITELSTSYGNATYTITDGTTEFLIFRGYYLEGAKFTSTDQLQVGDVVVVKGKLVNYSGTLEMNSGNSIVSLTREEKPQHAGTAEDPYTATDAALATAKLEDKVATTEEYYVTGTIVSISELSTSYGNATYTITDGKTNFLIFRGYYLEGAKFTSTDQLQVGDVVVVKGKLVNYNGTLEMNSGNALVSVEKGETPTPTPTPTPTEGTNIATFEFGEDDATKTDEGTQDGKEITTYTEDNNGYTLTLEGLSKVYGGSYDAKGNACLKLGTGKAVGTLTFTVADDVDFVIIKVAGYKKNVASISINGEDAVNVTTLSQDGEYTEIKIDTTTNKTVTLTTTSNGYRCKITSIAYWKAE